MRFAVLFSLILSLVVISSAGQAQSVSDFVGTWNVTSTPNTSATCRGEHQTSAYVWIVSVNTADDEVSVSVQGQTAFPNLRGHWYPFQGVLRLYGVHQDATKNSGSWFELRLENGELRGVRRYLSAGGVPQFWSDPDHQVTQVCFADFDVVATR